MDAELNHHFENDGVPLNMVELHEECQRKELDRVRLIRGTQTSGDENTTMVHLGIENPASRELVPWFSGSFDLVDLRNDWMTNHYFRDHPAHSETNSLVFVGPKIDRPLDFVRRLRLTTGKKDEFYWTLNQTEIWVRQSTDEQIELAFNTVTPNFEYFEVIVDGNERTEVRTTTLHWQLHRGENSIQIRTVNQFGVRGIESSLNFLVR